MRILVLTHYYATHLGGIEIAARSSVREFVRRGHDVTWSACVPFGQSAPVEPGVRMVPLRAFNFTEDRWGIPYPVVGPLGLASVASEVARTDVVHLHDCLYMAHLWASIVARVKRVPVVITQYVGDISYKHAAARAALSLAYRAFGRMALECASCVVFSNSRVERFFAGFSRPPVSMVHQVNAVDPALFFPPAADGERLEARARVRLDPADFVILFVGRFVERKGLDVIAQAARSMPEGRFVLVGDGPIDPRLWRIPNVTTAGRAPHGAMRDYYWAANCFFLPSHGEGIPFALTESLACGLPAVVTAETKDALPAEEELVEAMEADPSGIAAQLRRHRDAALPWDVRLRTAERIRRDLTWTRLSDFYLSLFSDAVNRRA